jgi:predicted acylesterase/phospholipase RssA
LLPANYLWLTVRVLFNRVRIYPANRLRNFFINHGVTPDLRFADLNGPRLFQVAADLNNYCPHLYGTDPEQSVLEGLLASTALPPWMMPLEVQEHFLMDGGVISNLPIESAINQGATRIYALDLSDPSEIEVETQGFGAFYSKLIATIEERQISLELALAEARQVPVHYLRLKAMPAVPIWDFSNTSELIDQGYQTTSQFLSDLQQSLQHPLWRWTVSMRDRLRSLRISSAQDDHHQEWVDNDGL